jgi:alpha,alpha-trehalose phosphorylase
VIRHPAFPVEPWVVRETSLDLDALAQTESVFALANGHIGVRGNLDEGEPFGVPGTYLSGFYELRPMPYAESGYGFSESNQTVVNVTNGKIMRLLVEDEALDVRYGVLRNHERVLDLRAGVLERKLEWETPSGRLVRIASTRLVSFTQRAIAAILYEVEAVTEPTTVVVQSELVANESLPEPADGDPRVAAALRAPLESELFTEHDTRSVLVHTTHASRLTVAAGMDHVIDGAADTEHFVEGFADLGRLTVSATVKPGKPLRIVKFIAYGWSENRSVPALRDQVGAALAAARRDGWDGLVAQQAAYLKDFWDRADVEIDGDVELQQAARFALFHVLQAGARTERRAIAAKGLTGPGYGGHSFWDSESFVMPVLTYTMPDAVRAALMWRYDTLDLARERAKQLNLAGATFPWRTIGGEECSGYWPASTAAFHINADIAAAVSTYIAAVDDEEFERRERTGAARRDGAASGEALVTTTPTGDFASMALPVPTSTARSPTTTCTRISWQQRNLQQAADMVVRRLQADQNLDVNASRRQPPGGTLPRDMIRSPTTNVSSVHPQSEGFTEHARLGFRARLDAEHVSTAAPRALLRPLSQASREAGGPRARDAALSRALSAFEQKTRDFDVLRSASRCATPRCRRARRRSSRPRSAISSSRSIISARRR